MESQKIVVLFATTDREEFLAFQSIVTTQRYPFALRYPGSLAEVDSLLQTGLVDVVVTDLTFQNGSFADWLFLWPFPFVLLADYSDRERIEDIIKDMSCGFLIREPEKKHLEVLPILLKKVVRDHEARKRQSLELQVREQQYLDLVQALPDVVYAVDENGYFTFINDAIREFGYEPVELIGKHFSVLLEPEEVPRVSRSIVLKQYEGKVTGPTKAPKLFDERRRGPRKTVGLEVKLRVKKKEGGMIPIEEGQRIGMITSYGQVDAAGFFQQQEGKGVKLKGSVGIIHDITQRKVDQELLQEALKEKNLLLKEIHHRVKNNLQIISSLLNLQRRYIKDPEDAKLFLDSQMQVRSMALVHEHLYQSDRISRIDMQSYLRTLCENLFEAYGAYSLGVCLDVQVEELAFEISIATPLGLLVNELVSNSLKYAFPEQRGGNISVQLYTTLDSCALVVTDDGVGLPQDFQLDRSDTLGYQLIVALVEQLEGTLEVLPQKGTAYRICFPYRSR
ncbi:MAG: PAS domain S-box protein [Spirochaetes bacterium]|nr:PAS domain S-box protein [Spirochaetota bacterium]